MLQRLSLSPPVVRKNRTKGGPTVEPSTPSPSGFRFPDLVFELQAAAAAAFGLAADSACSAGSGSPAPSHAYARPAIAAPAIGATQNSHNCWIAQPPTNRAGPVLRAGFTDVFVTGMLIRWIKVRQNPIAKGANPFGARLFRRGASVQLPRVLYKLN